MPGSHLWGNEPVDGATKRDSFSAKRGLSLATQKAPRNDGVQAAMPAGSLMVAKGTLWHRGGANHTKHRRLIVTPQYCAGWVRQLENMALATSKESTLAVSERTRELMGYNIHDAFMGYVNGMHPRRVLGLQD